MRINGYGHPWEIINGIASAEIGSQENMVPKIINHMNAGGSVVT